MLASALDTFIPRLSRNGLKYDAASYERVARAVCVAGSVSLAVAMATETGLIQSLCTATRPLASGHLASQLGLKERYVHQVLNSLTAAGLVRLEGEMEGTGGREGVGAGYWVPPTRRQTLQKVSIIMLVFANSARNYEDVRKCFDLHGPYGIQYEPSAYTVMDETARSELDSTTEAILDTPGLKDRLETGLRALDMGCGTATVSLHLAAMFPNSHFTLADLTPLPMDTARHQARTQGLTNVSFHLLDTPSLPDHLRDSFDLVICRNVVHDLPNPSQSLREVSKVLKAGGHFSLLDMFVSSYVAENVTNHREAAAMYGLGTFNCVAESYQSAECAALGGCWGVERATELVEGAGLRVLGVVRFGDFVVRGLCRCLKPVQ